MTIRSRMRYDRESGCSLAEAEHGYVMRLFAYFGGGRVLDALMNPIGEIKPPENAEEIPAWSDEAVTQILRKGNSGRGDAGGDEHEHDAAFTTSSAANSWTQLLVSPQRGCES